jgi:hypothetical protein
MTTPTPSKAYVKAEYPLSDFHDTSLASPSSNPDPYNSFNPLF